MTRAWCAAKFGSIAYIAFLGIICIFIIGYIVTYGKQCVKIRKNTFWICYTLYLTCIVLNLLCHTSASAYALIEYVLYMLFLFAMCYIMSNIAFEKILQIYEIIGIIVSIEAIWEFISGRILFQTNLESQVIRRAYGLIGSPLTLGMILACIILISIYRGMISNRKHYIVSVLAVIGLFCTQSRGPLVGAAVGFAVMMLVHNLSEENNAGSSLGTGVLKAVIMLFLLYQVIKWLSNYVEIANSIYQRIQTIMIWDSTESANYQRMEKWRDAWQLFKGNPIFGIGVSSTGSRAATGIVLESGVLKKLVEMGIIGFVLYYYMMISTAVKNIIIAMKNHSKYCALAVGVMCAIFVENFIMQIVESAGVFMIFMWFFTYLIFTNRGGVWIELIQENIKEYISNHKINMEKIDLYSILGVMEVDGLCLY